MVEPIRKQRIKKYTRKKSISNITIFYFDDDPFPFDKINEKKTILKLIRFKIFIIAFPLKFHHQSEPILESNTVNAIPMPIMGDNGFNMSSTY